MSMAARKLVLWAYLASSALFYVIVYVNAPFSLEPTAGIDGGLYITTGRHLAEGRWLGGYNQYTLAKGPGYPLFLAFADVLGLPVSLAQALLHVGAVALVTMISLRFVRSVLLVALLSTLLLWHPMPLLPPMLRIVRDDAPAAGCAAALAVTSKVKPTRSMDTPCGHGLVPPDPCAVGDTHGPPRGFAKS